LPSSLAACLHLSFFLPLDDPALTLRNYLRVLVHGTLLSHA
jgi:hypothetical protein